MEYWIAGRDTSEDILEYLKAWSASFDKTPIVCFDYFDTLVVRQVEPEHTKRLASRLLSFLLLGNVPWQEIYSYRREIEKQLCTISSENGGEPEFHFTDFGLHLYRELSQQNRDYLALSDDESFFRILLDIEVAVEIAVQLVHDEIFKVLQQVKANNFTTVLVSDFYLPESYFRKMLSAHALDEYIDHTFVSVDHGMMKGTGKMYHKICGELGCSFEDMIMIGDNLHADVNMAREQGIRTIHIQNPAQQEFYKQWSQEERQTSSYAEQQFARAFERKGLFPELGYSLWFFICKLFNRMVDERVEDIFFFSKEGQFLKILFDQFQRAVYGHRVVRSHYILVSRKSTFLASLRPLEDEDFLRLFDHYRDISLREFLLSLNFTEDFSEKLCRELELDSTTRFPDLKNRPEFRVVCDSEVFRQEYERVRQQQRRNFLQYLDSFEVKYRDKGLHIVDVGWKGSIQDNIYYILDGEIEIQGYYIGSRTATELSSNNQKTGILFSDRPVPSGFFNVYNNNRSLLEMILGATHGSADAYYTKHERQELQLTGNQSVYLTAQGQDAEIEVIILDLPDERQLYEEVIRPLQEGILKLAGRLNKSFILSECNIPDERWFARQHARVVFYPIRDEISQFEKLYHLENFGIFEYSDFLSDTQITLRQRIRNLREVVRNRDILESGIWPPIILNRLGLGLLQKIDGTRRYYKEFYR